MPSVPRNRRRLWPLALLSVISTALAQSPPTGDLYRHYAGRRDPLDLDPTRIVVETRADITPDTLLLALRDKGVFGTAAEPTGVPRWHLIALRERLADIANLRAMLDRALQAAPVQFAAPVFHGMGGAFVTITPDLMLQKQPTATARAIDLLAELVPTATVFDGDFGGMPGAIRAHSPARNGLDVLAEANRLAEDARIAWAEPDWQFSGRADVIPNDPGWGQLWGMRNTGQFGGTAGMDMDCDLAWDITTGSASVRVCVIDNGVQQDHPDINQLAGADFTGQGGSGGPVNACDNHGTAVAGCISAILNNGLGTVGTAPNCRSISARTFISTVPCNGSWTSQTSWTVSALAFAQTQGCRVTNNSNGYGFTSAAIDAQYATTYAAGIVHFAAAGNNSSATIDYPSSLEVVNAVSALASNGDLTSFSNFGTGIDFSAPGQDVYSTDRTGADGYDDPGDYALIDGTSFASPYTAGIAALVLSQTPSMTAPYVELALRAARDRGATGYDTTFGWGFVNANSALRSIPYGVGLGGSGGFVPQLFAGGILCIGNVITTTVDRGLGGSVAVVCIGSTAAAIPLFGGTLLVSPPLVLATVGLGGSLGTPGAGSGTIDVSIPNSVSLANASVYLQAGVLDPATPQDIALSNGLQIRIGPVYGVVGPITNSIGMQLQPIAAGTFLMGSNATTGSPYYSPNWERPVHQVTISQPFWMGKFEVTQAQYQAVMGVNPSYFQGASWPNSASRPVEQVSWNSAMAFCAALNAIEAGSLPTGYHYRLPTEAEWEYCCRAGGPPSDEFHYGPTLDCGQARFYYSYHTASSCGSNSTVQVGNYLPNAWGLYDMHGNVWEWCRDSWDGSGSANYPAAPVTDPYVTSGPYRVLRGGCWDNYSYYCRSALRSGDYPANLNHYIGFRVVLAPVLP
ncbi:MAG: SUMF1/EgtB/PvdO family nonheme iron enzyme [Planctomycetes bacterium]|nr:SUMF1/EgtB/PvdO family nonheme iron enzyme [Planctomycetota bacterium]